MASHPSSFKRITLGATVALGAWLAALPAFADTVEAASWSQIVAATSFDHPGSALGTFATSGVTVDYGTDVLGGSAASIVIRSGGVHQLTFSQTVHDPLLTIDNLISGNSFNSFTFDRAFTPLSGNLVVSNNKNLHGTPLGASGVVRFDGDITSISWTNGCEFVGNPVSFTVGLSVAAVPEPETYALVLAGLGVMGCVARRRSLLGRRPSGAL